MNYTKNYRLPKWVKSDRIMMDDFNQMNDSIEAGLTKTENTANSAKANADQAVATANAAAAAKPYVVGTYTGDGTVRTFNLGFKPSFLIISGMRGVVSNNDDHPYLRYFGITGGNVLKSRVSLSATGFTVYPYAPTVSGSYPSLNEDGKTYDYIAFK